MQNEMYKVTYVAGSIEMDVDGVPYLLEIPYAIRGTNIVIKEKNTGKVIFRDDAYLLMEYEESFCGGVAALLLEAVLEWKKIKRL